MIFKNFVGFMTIISPKSPIIYKYKGKSKKQ